jgi:endonuclease/exonuclease/phosphatase family metal-dependent hydrolase
MQLPLTERSRTNASSQPQFSMAIPQRSAATILVGSFNLQRLGPTKLSDPWVMERLAEIIRRLDVVALQEITSQNQPAVQILVNKVNEIGAQYAYVESPPIGRVKNYSEQYAFVYDATRLFSGPEYTYVVRDEADLLHREPFVARFLTRFSPDPFRFTLINVHTDPDEIGTELDVLADVYVSVRQFEYPEDDVVLLGDFNASPDRMQKLGGIPAFLPLIADLPTNARKNKTLDNILIDSQTTREFTGRAGTIDMESVFGLTSQQVLEVSDHLPVWAEFTIAEQTVTSAALSGGMGRLR